MTRKEQKRQKKKMKSKKGVRVEEESRKEAGIRKKRKEGGRNEN